MAAMAYQTPENGKEQVDVAENKGMVHRGQDIKGRPVVDIDQGEKIGEVSEILFDPERMRVAALVVARGYLFNREVEHFSIDQVKVWGKDAILVERRGDEMEKLPDRDRLVKLSDQIKGRYVVSTDGTRVGQINDVMVNMDGDLSGFQLSQVFVDGSLSQSKQIPVKAVHSIGQDVVIVDMEKV